MKGICVLCDQPVTDEQTAAYRVTGWEVERFQGGANHIAERHRIPDVVVHAVCLQSRLHRAKLGIGDAQGTLL